MPKRTSINLTTTRIERSRHNPQGAAQQFLWDNQVPGLGVLLLASGIKSYVVRYRLAGTPRRMTIAAVGAIGLDAAREQARKIIEQGHRGADPLALKRGLPPPTPALTVGGLYLTYTAKPYFQSRSPDFQRNFKSTMTCHVLPVIGEMQPAEVRRQDVRLIAEALADKGREGAATAVLTHSRILFNEAVDRELIEANPAIRLRLRLAGTGRRDRWLQTADELRSAWFAVAKPQAVGMIRWIMMTGCRRDEARLARWGQIAAEADGSRVWTVEATKSGRPLVLPVTGLMQGVLRDMEQTFPGSPYIFPGLQSSLQPIARGSTDYLVRPLGWSWHVLRHSVESHLAELGVHAEARDAILNHAGRGVGDRYRHGRQLGMKRTGLEVWHAHLAAALGL
jgi:integrase